MRGHSHPRQCDYNSPVERGEEPPADSDDDAIPDEWESEHGRGRCPGPGAEGANMIIPAGRHVIRIQ